MNSRRRVPQMEDVKVTRMINGPEAFTPDNEFCLGRDRDPRPVRGRRASARTGWRARAGSGKVMAEWIAAGRAVARPLAHGHPPLRRPIPLALLHAQANPRDLRDLLRHPLPRPRARGRPAAAGVAGQRLASRARRRLRREVGLGAGELVRGKRGGGDESAAPARVGRAALVAGDRAPSTRPAARPPPSSTSPRSPRWRSPGPAPPRCSSASATTGSPARSGRITYTQMLNSRGGHRVRLHRRPARRGALLDRHRHRLRQPRSRVDPPPPARRRLGAGARRDLGLGLLRDLGPARARRARPAHPAVALQRGLPLPERARDHRRRRARARAAGDVRRRAGLGALLPDRVRAGAVADRSGRRASRTAWWPAATARSTPCASRRATASGARTSRRTRLRTRAASASA